MTFGKPGSDRWFDRHGSWLLALATLAPLVRFNREFRDLFWFGDDWDLLDQMARTSAWTWTWQVFAENFVPIFKLLWVAMVAVGGGHYFWMILCLWLTHALNAALLCRLLRQNGVGIVATVLAVAMFGFSASNIETLGWATQWSSILSSTFFLAAAISYTSSARIVQASAFRSAATTAAWAAASALSFSRGVITGASLAAASLIPSGRGSAPWSLRLRYAAACIAPAVIIGALIFFMAGGNQHNLLPHLGEATTFAAWNYGLNPIDRILRVDSFGWRTTVILSILKVALVVWAYRRGSPEMRRMLVLLVLADLGNSVLLGIGRYHTGLTSTIGSRYQYHPLICGAPVVALAVDALRQSIGRRWQFVRAPAMAVALVALATWQVGRYWREEAVNWANNRGRNTRELLFVNPNPPPAGAIPGIDFMSTARAKELVAKYNLR